jgi:hypothetical protein
MNRSHEFVFTNIAQVATSGGLASESSALGRPDVTLDFPLTVLRQRETD